MGIDPVSIERGGLPIQRSSLVAAESESQGIYEDEHQEFTTDGTEASDGRSAIVLDGAINGTGSIAMNGGANFECLWTPPATGNYRVSATYHSWGSYAFGPPEDADHEYTAYSAATIAALQNCEQVVASETRPDLRIGSPGLGEQVAEELLEQLAY